MRNIRYTNKRLTVSGGQFELCQYDDRIRIDPLPQSKYGRVSSREKKKKEHREDSSVYRSRKQLKRLINANAGFHMQSNGKPYRPIFITFTFAENIQDTKTANYRFTKFIQRFNYEIFGQKKSILRYIVAIEFQKRGAVHYHAVFFNLPFRENMKKIIQEIWAEGFIKIETIKSAVTDVGNYLTKYMSKEQMGARLVGKKCYFSSHNLFKPVVIKDQVKIEAIMSFLRPEQKVYERKIDEPEFGPSYLYSVYNIEDTGFVAGLLDLFFKRGYLDEKL
jgi:hypothetical protein